MKVLAPPQAEAVFEVTTDELENLKASGDGWFFRSEGSDGGVFFWLLDAGVWILLTLKEAEK